jgi:Xaa-Pro aminopeptidase
MLLNKSRADSFLESYGIDALVSSSRENTSYITNFLAVEHVFTKMYSAFPGSGENFIQVYGIYARDGTRILIIPSSMYMIMKSDDGVTKEVLTYGKGISLAGGAPTAIEKDSERESDAILEDPKKTFEDAAAALTFALREYAPGEKLAVDMSEMQDSTLVALKNSRFSLGRANELFRFLRMVKSEEEISRLTSAAEINEGGLEAIFQAAYEWNRKTITESDLQSEYLRRVTSLGGTGAPGLVMCPVGSRGGAMSSPSRYSILTEEKKMLWVDSSCRFLGYNADTGESASIGKPSELQRKRYDAVLDAVETCEEVLVAGIKPGELNSRATAVFEKHAVPRPPTGMGHGIGLEIYDYPRISAVKGDAASNPSAIRDDFIRSSIDIPFEEGMVIALEAPYLVRGWGGVLAEVTVVLEKSRSRRLVRDQKRCLREL